MQTDLNKVGAFEAKTKLSELLRETERGTSFVILKRGKPVARLVPMDLPISAPSEMNWAAAFREVRTLIKDPVDIRSLIEEGRR
jgi:prevent-host-death family protein